MELSDNEDGWSDSAFQEDITTSSSTESEASSRSSSPSTSSSTSQSGFEVEINDGNDSAIASFASEPDHEEDANDNPGFDNNHPEFGNGEFDI